MLNLIWINKVKSLILQIITAVRSSSCVDENQNHPDVWCLRVESLVVGLFLSAEIPHSALWSCCRVSIIGCRCAGRLHGNLANMLTPASRY